MKKSKEVKTAILVLAGVGILIFGINFLRGENILGSSRIYFAEYNNVEGLNTSSPITINGLSVGKILDIDFKKDGSGKLLVKFLVDNDYQFSKNSRAELYESGLIGGKSIAIIPAFDNAGNAEKNDTLRGTVKLGIKEVLNEKIKPLQRKIEKAMGGADNLLLNLNDILDDTTKENLKKSIYALLKAMESFKNTSNSLNGLMNTNKDKITSVIANVEIATKDLTKMTGSLSKSDLGQTVKNLESTIKNFDVILMNLKKGEGSMGKLLKNDELYNNLKGASKELEALLKDVKLHPKRYTRILSKKEIPYSEQETE